MSLFISSLNSGSNGNCYYIANDREAILVDVGISCKETEKRMLSLGLSMNKVRAIFISHEHTDHIKGLAVISAKYQLPVFITQGTYQNSGLKLDASLTQWIRPNEAVRVGELLITSFPKKHDAADPQSFIIKGNGATVGVFTDIGKACSNVTHHFSQCDAAFLEANYDEDMLENGRYPIYLKNRIRSDEGHLSNKQALDIFTRFRPPFMTHLLLSHLSKDNNDPQLAQQLFQSSAQQTKIIVASREEASPVYTILPPPFSIPAKAKAKKAIKPKQLLLFE
jgi:phosphoribosyl 1,2-cyclic phosphodiesterase